MTVPTLAIYAGAALAEIAGCFAFWAWLRMGKSAWWTLPGTAALILFALLLTRAEPIAAGRAYAAYGGIYIVAALGWMLIVEKIAATRWDMIGGTLALAGCLVILAGPR